MLKPKEENHESSINRINCHNFFYFNNGLKLLIEVYKWNALLRSSWDCLLDHRVHTPNLLFILDNTTYENEWKEIGYIYYSDFHMSGWLACSLHCIWGSHCGNEHRFYTQLRWSRRCLRYNIVEGWSLASFGLGVWTLATSSLLSRQHSIRLQPGKVGRDPGRDLVAVEGIEQLADIREDSISPDRCYRCYGHN